MKLTLLDAYRLLGPLLGEEEEDARRNAAGDVVLAELERLVETLPGIPRQDRDDVLAGAFMNLLKRSRRSFGDTEGSHLAYYLRRALWLEWIDIDRKRRREGRRAWAFLSLAPPRLRPAPLGANRVSLLRELVALIRVDLGAKQQVRFDEDVEDLIHLREGRRTMDDVVRDRGANCRAAIDQRHSRTRKSLATKVEAMATGRARFKDRVPTVDETQQLREIVRSLRRRA
jgi:hypothetical protein